MRILHFIPSTDSKSDFILSYVSELSQAMGKIADVHIVTFKTKEKKEAENVHFHLIDAPTVASFIKLIIQFNKKLDEINPDIVHIHGCWNFTLRMVELLSNRKGYPVVLSTYGGLHPTIMKTDFWKSKLPKLILYQYLTVRKADAILIYGDEEYKNISDLGWKRRLGKVESPHLNPDTTYTETASSIIRFYNKVIDTRNYTLLDDNAKDAISSLLHVGLSKDNEKKLLDADDIINLRNINAVMWRRIFIYTYDEGVLDIIKRGIDIIQLNTPKFVIDNVERFKSKRKRTKGHLESDKIISAGSTISRKTDKYEHCNEKTICIMMMNIRSEINKMSVTLLHFSELYIMIKYTDYDEDKLIRMLSELHIFKFSARIMQILSELFYLEEGFMPIDPIDDRKTRQIRINFTKNA